MSITDDMLMEERDLPIGGVQRIYMLPNGYALSLVNAPALHSYKFAWEAAVLSPGMKFVSYDTPLTNDVEVFSTDDEANAFIQKAKEWAK